MTITNRADTTFSPTGGLDPGADRLSCFRWLIFLRIALVLLVAEGVIRVIMPVLLEPFQGDGAHNTWLTTGVHMLFAVLLAAPAIFCWAIRPTTLARNNALEALRAQNYRLSEAQSIAKIGSWELDIKSGDLRWSDEIYRIFEVAPGAFGGTYADFLTYVHPEDREMNDTAYKTALDKRVTYDATYRIVVPGGGVKWLHERCNTVFDADGNPLRSFGTAQDITRQKVAEKAKSDFISTISHELRTPLTSIKGALGLVRAGAAGTLPDKARSMLDIAYGNSDRLHRLINDILDFAKLESGMMTFHLGHVDLAALVREAIAANDGYADLYGVRFKASGIDAPLVLEGDKDRLMQVLANLMSNAAKFSPRGGEVEIAVSDRGAGIRLVVKDYGVGIPKTAQASIFERFTQADSANQRQAGGTGLGLSIAKTIVERHGGEIGFTSEEGVGTTFAIDLPKCAPARPALAG
ncbi:sensor histidine kinase [Actibacterium sp. D379-3]